MPEALAKGYCPGSLTPKNLSRAKNNLLRELRLLNNPFFFPAKSRIHLPSSFLLITTSSDHGYCVDPVVPIYDTI